MNIDEILHYFKFFRLRINNTLHSSNKEYLLQTNYLIFYIHHILFYTNPTFLHTLIHNKFYSHIPSTLNQQS